jgi:ATP-dependent Clp protease protease subunit
MSKTIYIKFFAGVDGNSANALMSAIDDKLKNGYDKIVLLISSPGGTVFHGLSLYNYLAGIPAEVETHNFGSVDSIGVVIFCAGKKRYSVPDARFLVHAVSTGFTANTRMEEKQIEETLKGLHIDIENIAAVIANNTGKTEANIVQAMADRTTLSPEEAKTFGLVHEIKSELFPIGAEVVAINMG